MSQLPEAMMLTSAAHLDEAVADQRAPRVSGPSTAAKALLGASLLVAGAVTAWQFHSGGHQSATLADFRRFDMAKEIVELDAEVLDPAKSFNCFLDNSQLIFRTMQSVLMFKNMPSACADLSTPESRGACTVAFNGGFLNMMLIGTMIAAAIADCSNTINIPASCTAVSTGFMASLEVLPTGIGAIIANCDTWWRHARINQYGVTTTKAPLFTTRTHRPLLTTRAPVHQNFPTLVPSSWLEKKEAYDSRVTNSDTYNTYIGFCIVDTFQSFLFLGRALMCLMDMAKWCPPAMQKTLQGRVGCTADIMNWLAAVSNIANFLADAVPSCGQAGDVDSSKAACAAGIALIPEAIFAVAGTAFDLPVLCPEGFESVPPTPVPVVRARIDNNNNKKDKP